MIRRSPVTGVHARKIGIKAETAGIYRRKPRYENPCRVTINAFERLERSAVKVARSVLRRAQSGNWLCLSDSNGVMSCRARCAFCIFAPTRPILLSHIMISIICGKTERI